MIFLQPPMKLCVDVKVYKPIDLCQVGWAGTW